MTVAMLIQVDKLVQLLESPIFTSLRLQLLDPEKNPCLLKAMYGLLMLLPQSSAFATLRNRLSAVSNMGAGTRSTYAQTARSNLPGRDSIKWNELLTHFRNVQNRHERSRRSNNPHAPESLVPGMAATQVGRSSGSGTASIRRLTSASSSSTSTPRRRATNASTTSGLASVPVSASRIGTAGETTGPATSTSALAGRSAGGQAARMTQSNDMAPSAGYSNLGLSGVNRPLSPSAPNRAKSQMSNPASRIASGRTGR